MPIDSYPFRVSAECPFNKPLVPVVLYNPANDFSYETWGLIDTGADMTCIPEYIAKALYHDVRNHKAKKDMSSGIGGEVKVYMHTFSLDVLYSDSNGKVTPNRFAIRIPKREFAVVPNLHMVILGEKDFLKNYVLTIDYPNKNFSLKKPAKPAKAKPVS